MGDQGLFDRRRRRDVAAAFPQGHHHRALQSAGREGEGLAGLPLLAVRVHRGAGARCERERGRVRNHRAAERRLRARRGGGRDTRILGCPGDGAMQVVTLEDERGTLTVLLAPLTGADEVALADAAAPHAAIALLRRLAHAPDGSPLAVNALTVSQADRLLAALYRALYDDRAECRMRCKDCGEGYEFTLSLSGVIAAQDRERTGAADESSEEH